MAYTTFYEGVCFIEGNHPNAKQIQRIKADLSFRFGAQLKNLNDVKAELASQAKILGCNAVIHFTYGQKSRWLAIDDVAFFGEGIASIIPENELIELKEK